MSGPGIDWGRLALVAVILVVLFALAVASKWLIVQTTWGVWVVLGLLVIVVLVAVISDRRRESE